MTLNDKIAAAIANREKRLAQVAALRPLRVEAQEKAREMGGQIDRAKRAGQGARFTRSMQSVPGFFPTPAPLVARMIEEAEFETGVQLRILEPECGKGNIAIAVQALGHAVYCVEKIQALADYSRKLGLAVQCADFLTLTLRDFSLAEGVGGFDRVLMNPPFENRQDEKHLKHAYSFLKDGGKLVAIVSSTTGQRLEEWAESLGGFVEDLPAQSFRYAERPTLVNVSLVVIYK